MGYLCPVQPILIFGEYHASTNSVMLVSRFCHLWLATFGLCSYCYVITLYTTYRNHVITYHVCKSRYFKFLTSPYCDLENSCKNYIYISMLYKAVMLLFKDELLDK
jgi:hypothetical protein